MGRRRWRCGGFLVGFQVRPASRHLPLCRLAIAAVFGFRHKAIQRHHKDAGIHKLFDRRFTTLVFCSRLIRVS